MRVILFIVREFHDAVRSLQQIIDNYVVVCRNPVIRTVLPEYKTNLHERPEGFCGDTKRAEEVQGNENIHTNRKINTKNINR